MTGFATVQSAVQAMKLGAYDYVTKPFNFEELRLLLERAAAHLKLTAENRLLREQVKSKHGFGSLVGHAPEMEKLYRIIAKAAHSTHPVLILGESGTGKELVARSIHYCGPFRDRPFIPVDCGSLVPTLIESELFGYVRGAFTGAVRAKDGLLATAEGGTVFLDEVGELPVDLQAKLLRAIQEKEVRPVGGTRAIPINVRILAATNRDLDVAVQQGTFRRDLYFRLNVLTLRIPPLRERKQDIPLLIGNVLERINGATQMQHSVGDDALRLMLNYDWPGNVRELENCLERACTTCSLPTIHIADLPTQLRNFQAQAKPPHPGFRSGHRYAHRRVGEADHPARDRSAARGQAGSGAPSGHRQNHAVSQTEGIRLGTLRFADLRATRRVGARSKAETRAVGLISAAPGASGNVCRANGGKEEPMILLVTTSSRAQECAAALQQGTGQPTQVANSVPQAVTRLQTTEYDALAIDQSLLEADFRALDTLLNHAGTALPIYVNLALHHCDRVVREAQVALRRAEKEKQWAMGLAERVLRNRLRAEVTGILLTSELALRQPAIPAEVVAKIRLVQDMAEKMRSQLHVL